MSFQYTRAKRENVNLIIALAGASGSGKTFSAMKIANGICGDDPFLMIDTEARRGLHYADKFNFEHNPLLMPFHPDKYLEAVRDGAKRGFAAIVIDSMSHEWAGEGGILEMADKDGSKSPSNWIKPKAAHKRMMNGFLQADTNLIFCLRADEKIRIIPDPHKPGKMMIEHIGWVPIAEKRMLFEMTVSFTLSPTAPGIIDTSLPHKCQDQHRLMFPHGQHITEKAGRELRQWAGGATVESPDDELWRRAREISEEGTVKLTDYFNISISESEKTALAAIKRELWESAKKADANMMQQHRGEQEQAEAAGTPQDSAPPADDFPGDRPSQYDARDDDDRTDF